MIFSLSDRETDHLDRSHIRYDILEPLSVQDDPAITHQCMTSAQNDAIMVFMSPEDASRVGAAGEVLASNIKRVRTAQRLSFAELSRMLTDIGRPIPELGLRRIELGTRRVDFDDLLAISYALEVAPVDLMVSKDAKDDDPYPLIPRREFTAASVREWISGETVLLESYNEPDAFFRDPNRSMFDALQWMPKARRVDVLRTLTEAEQWAVDNPELAIRQQQELEQNASHPDTRTT